MIFWVESEDDWRCDCGNYTLGSGFESCLRDGTPVEPTEEDGWDDHMRCCDCGYAVSMARIRQRKPVTIRVVEFEDRLAEMDAQINGAA